MYIKRVELTNFKSFGGTTPVPLLPGFTVVSGPNGSGKSNILDALLFALGLSSSKGMRAERLPDLVNHAQATRGRSMVEASVSVTFDLEEETGKAGIEWLVTRKLRVTQQGTYTSNYYINGEACNLTELHEELNRLRIYPEGYNVVLQGDVTGIISMNPRERREIIDELAGVAAFDRKIHKAREKLNEVKDREERCRIVEKELVTQRDRLAQDRQKAEKYQRLRQELQNKTQWEAILNWRQGCAELQRLQQEIATGDRSTTDLQQQLATLLIEIERQSAELEQLNAKVKALGEEELLALQSTLATREAELRQLQRQEQDLRQASQDVAEQIQRSQRELQEQFQQLEGVGQEKHTVELQDLPRLRQEREQAQTVLNRSREAATAIAAASEAWVQQQTQLSRQIQTLLQSLDPQRTERASLQERSHQLNRQIQEQSQTLSALEQEIASKQAQSTQVLAAQEQATQHLAVLTQALSQVEQQLQVQQETQTRLLQEQREKQRRLDKLEAQAQAMQESQGTNATRIILQTGMPGVCGLVAQLGRVDPRYQLALETAAGARLGHLVVEDDSIAAAGIELLKQKRAGRATFLPLNKIQVNKIQAPRLSPLPPSQRPEGLIDYAVNLIECDARYQNVFAFVFGNTVVFATLEQARRHLGQFRIVTLEGELLEASGAMTGGSVDTRYSMHFGTAKPEESAEVLALKTRLREIEQILDRGQQQIAQAVASIKQRQQTLMEARQAQREQQLQAERLQTDTQTLGQQQSQLRSQLHQNQEELSNAQARLHILETTIPAQENQLQQWRQALAELEQSHAHSEWQQIQATIREQEAQLSDRDLSFRGAEQRLKDLASQQQRLQEKIHQSQQRLQDCRQQQTAQLNQSTTLTTQQAGITAQIQQLQIDLAALEQTLSAEKQERDRVERQWRDRQTARQQLEWQLQKLQETQQSRQQAIATLEQQLQTQQAELPDPLPEVPADFSLEQLQQELRSLQKRLQAMEPVNMLALEEYERTQTRLQELTQKLQILDEERTELLLRIENFTTLRQRAFREAFDAVNQNFQAIFAELSDGDGYLQLDDLEDPFSSGLNLVAHPKGKPVQRLASMSGGEKSLTALSFIFALQRYRPSPFYAFDEVDMFLDGANVERLARMIRKQAQQAQFIVVSLRRPMIESAERTIGVTQARGAYTQVLGIQLQPQSASV